MEYTYYIHNSLAADGAAMSLSKLLAADALRKMRKREKLSRREARTERKTYQDAEFYDHAEQTLPEESKSPPVVVCVGSDLAIGDSLGPIVGSMLQYKTQGLNAFIYGTLSAPVTAKEIPYLREFLRETHTKSQILAVDAAVGEKGDIGLIKLTDSPLLPGAGANKKLGAVGDIAVMGIVAEKSVSNYGLLNTTRLNLVYTMSEIISDAVANVLWERCSAHTAPKISRQTRQTR
ncbi:MAG: spore protease YyaC [Clostridia bacterium]|nr:spore protease YyaC [Clostridia bacterium]